MDIFVKADNLQHRSYCHKVVSANTVVAKATADVNGDGSVNSFDAMIVLKHATGYENVLKSESNRLNADVNGDGRINSADALTILRIATGDINI